MAARDKRKQQSENNGMQAQQSARDILKKRKQSMPKKEKFIRSKMWVNFLLSMMEKDRGKIPDNIGNKILITNNLYVTKAYMSSLIQITGLSLETPVTLLQEIIKALRDEGSKAVVDFTMKNTNFEVRLKDSGLLSRINLWERSMENEDIPDKEKEIAARCLYTVDQVKDGKRLFQSRIFLTVRAKTGSGLSKAEKIIYKYLTGIGAEYLPVNSNIKNMLKYISLVSDYKDRSVKDIKSIINSEQTMSQLLPNVNSWNDRKGLFCGVNITNNSQYLLGLDEITIARNMYCIAPSGVGKTVLALNMVSSAVESGWAACIQDIKGNEFTNFVNGTGGYIVSLRQNSSGYINSFRMNKEDIEDSGAEMYFKSRLAFSKKQMTILSGIEDHEKKNELEELLDEFLESLYISLGVLPANTNTWKKTKGLTPFRIYDALTEYMSPTVQKKYGSISKNLFVSLRMFMSKNGSKSYLFKQEFDYAAILRSNTLMFDFGVLEGSHNDIDPALFRLKFAYMQRLNAEFISYKYSKGIKVLKVLEESQIAANDPEILKSYVEEYTLRRAQGQSTLLIGNSISALADHALSKPLIENTKALFIGKLAPDAREEVIKRFGLQEHEEILKTIGSDEEHDNAFLFVNNMQSGSLTPLLKIILDKNKKYKLLSPVAQGNDLAL